MTTHVKFAAAITGALFLAACSVETAHQANQSAPGKAAAEDLSFSSVAPTSKSRPVRTRRASESVAQARPLIKHKTAPAYQPPNRDRFELVTENGIQLTAENPVSTFSIDVDTASYGFVRRTLNRGALPPKDAVRLEELINYFDYDYPESADRAQSFQPTITVAPSPWRPGNKLVHIGIKGYEIDPGAKPRSNLVFLLDVSGSMNAPDKLPLMVSSMKLLLNALEQDDTVSIVNYEGRAGTVLEPTEAADSRKILAALNRLRAGGSTAGGECLARAYDLAEEAFDPDEVNRVILATDGDFNVGASSPAKLKDMIERRRKSGIYLSVLGFGAGNLNDVLMQALAQNSNGVAAHIDNLNEAHKVLVEEATSTLFPIAKDVKIQVEFNPATVAEYRLIGYETRKLKREDFRNDKIDAGDIGAGHSVTAIYEITPVGSDTRIFPESRYQKIAATPARKLGDEYGFLKIRYKLPKEDRSRLIEAPITTAREIRDLNSPGYHSTRWATAIAAFGQLLKGARYMENFGYRDVIALARSAKGEDEFGYRAEFINLARLAGAVTPQ